LARDRASNFREAETVGRQANSSNAALKKGSYIEQRFQQAVKIKTHPSIRVGQTVLGFLPSALLEKGNSDG